LDVISWIALSVIAFGAVAIVTGWLLSGRGHHGRGFSFARRTLAGLLLACLLLLWVDVLADGGAKKVVFDGWLDSVVDSIDGTSDRDERIAKQREGSGGGLQGLKRLARARGRAADGPLTGVVFSGPGVWSADGVLAVR
jgi:hypothetical protein